MRWIEDEGLRTDIARIVETVAIDGLPGPCDLDVALDAILEAIKDAVRRGGQE